MLVNMLNQFGEAVGVVKWRAGCVLIQSKGKGR